MVTDTHAVTIVRLVRADLIAWPRVGVRPLTVAFTNTSTCSYTASLWDFWDGVTSTLPAPTHTYEISRKVVAVGHNSEFRNQRIVACGRQIRSFLHSL